MEILSERKIWRSEKCENMEGEGEKILPKRLRLGLGLLAEGGLGLLTEGKLGLAV